MIDLMKFHELKRKQEELSTVDAVSTGARIGRPPKVPTLPRTVGDVNVSAEAQRIFNPGMPSAPSKPKAPTAAQQDSGTSASIGTSGNWGKSE